MSQPLLQASREHDIATQTGHAAPTLWIISNVTEQDAFLLWVETANGSYLQVPVAQMVKNPPAMWETWVPSLGWEDPLEKEMATHSSTLAWKIPWTEEPCRLQSMGSQRVRHDWATSLHFTSYHVGSQSLDQGSNPWPLHWKLRANQWPTREVLYWLDLVYHFSLCSLQILFIRFPRGFVNHLISF